MHILRFWTNRLTLSPGWGLLGLTWGVTILAGMQAAGPHPATYWPHTRQLTAPASASSPALLVAPDWQAVIWQSPLSNSVLVLTRLDQAGDDLPFLTYPGVAPVRWEAVPALAGTAHLVWQERDGGLYNAWIDQGGQILRGPVELALDALPGFRLLPQPGGTALVFWIDAHREIAAARLDTLGRPQRADNYATTQAERFAIQPDHTGTFHAAWLAPTAPGEWALYYQAARADQLEFTSSVPLYRFSLLSEETLASFEIGLDETNSYLVWGIYSAENPAWEQVRVLAFPLGNPAVTTVTELRLPRLPTDRDPALTLPGGYSPLQTDPLAPLRWLRAAPGQGQYFLLAATLRSPDGWRPVVLYFQQGTLRGLDIVAPLPADAGPPTLAAVQDGNLIAAWSGLEHALPHVYLSTTNAAVLKAGQDVARLTATGWLAHTLAWLPLALIWLAIPACLAVLAAGRTWPLVVAGLVYGAGKLIWPPGLFSTLPPLLYMTGLDRLESGFAVGLGCGLAGLSGMGGWVLARHFKRPVAQAWLIYSLLDALFTWLIFGANSLP